MRPRHSSPVVQKNALKSAPSMAATSRRQEDARLPRGRASAAAPRTGFARAICGSTPRILSLSNSPQAKLRRCFPWPTAADCCWARRSIAPPRRSLSGCVSRNELTETAWPPLLADRLRASIRRRKPLLDGQTDSCRLCFSEADELPGLVVDKYGELVILQLLVKGLDSSAIRQACVRVVGEELAPAAILERPDPRVRELEGLSAPDLTPLWASDPTNPVTSTQFKLNGLIFHYDANSGQKTGAFLDQRANYAAAADWARRLNATGRALDVCTYQGGFALHLARVCKSVTGIDSSRSSLEVAERNQEANRTLLGAQVDWVEGDAFEILRDWSEAGEKFDTIILDPPAFAKSQRAVEGALRGYKELNLRAFKMLRPGGQLVTCSCSHHVGWADLEASVASAAADAHRRVRLLERRGAAPDHPVILNLPETEYLKCLILEAE